MCPGHKNRSLPPPVAGEQDSAACEEGVIQRSHEQLAACNTYRNDKKITEQKDGSRPAMPNLIDSAATFPSVVGIDMLVAHLLAGHYRQSEASEGRIVLE